MKSIRGLYGLFFAFLFVVAVTGVNAQEVSSEDKAAFESIITNQIAAFRADNATKAFSFAAPVIREKFGNPDVFMHMVRRGYGPVYRPKEFSFGTISLRRGKPHQHVRITGPQGNLWIALYEMEKQPDGTWRISGVTLLKPEGESA